MDLLRETAPFLIGMIVSPLAMLFIRTTWSSQLKFTIVFLPALILGFCISAVAGELAVGMPDGLIAVIIDTSLVFTGSQLAYRLFWKPILEARLQSVSTTRMQRVHE